MSTDFFVKTTLAALLAMPTASHTISVDHQEFDATLQAPFRADNDGGRDLTLRFAQQAGLVRWRLDLLASGKETVLRQWRGERQLDDPAESATVTLRWQASAAIPAGVYRLRLRASLDGAQDIEQTWPVAVGPPPPPAFAPLIAATPLPEAAPFDIYLGNLHSQTGHSDGGGALGQCSGAQAPQSAPLGPSDAYAYAQRHHLDFLMTSEHNHMYDGSDGTNPNADAAAARALFRARCSTTAGTRRTPGTWDMPAFSRCTGRNGASSTTAATLTSSTATSCWAGSATRAAPWWPIRKRRKATTPPCTL